MPENPKHEEGRLPLVEERLTVTKRAEVTGTVRLRKVVRTEEQPIEEALQSEEILVERVPIDRWIDGPVAIREEGETTIYPVLEEIAVVEKRLKLVEEVHVTRRRVARQMTDHVEVRREEMIVERVAPDAKDKPAPA